MNSRTRIRLQAGLVIALLLLAVISACANNATNEGATPSPTDTDSPAETAQLSGQIEIDGSSTVFPIMEAISEEFNKEQPNIKAPIGVSGTGGGFKRFCTGEIAISNASRPIKDEEKTSCQEKGIEFMDLAVAYDGLSVVVSKENDFVDHLKIDELTKIFGSENTAKTWKDVRPEWPAEKILIFSPGADSGTFDYFNEVILDKKGLRSDEAVSLSEDDNTLVQGVAGSKYGIGYFGFAYYEENADKLKIVPIDGGKGPITPSRDTIKDGSYSPLSRPLFIYVNKKEYGRPEVRAFVDFAMDNVPTLAEEVGYIPLPDEKYAEQKAKLK
ncbi:PstS family phosphate ABC transporter substrate-binding protein [Cohnella luojiensis]|uniref:Phosphate-binding protein n=1 Tax=Cohnella luojiensis TaxID=652876 RepID=A0A4Y8MA11_9BACL|nr:PstS family phosphate ABC transporter substrate-binding protein [Cohnella luojiensis]TFE30797.1 PstS family phosphate ABC transporter substrate-binding protein [Cohnella luojiensis]